MTTKLPERFLKADPDSPCQGCDKVRKTCRFCERCKDCCDCPICPFCGGAETDKCCSEFTREVGEECHCEPCANCRCTRRVDSWNPYGVDEAGCWCDKCGPKHFAGDER